MSHYPTPAAGQGLYEVSSTRKAKLGTVATFQTDDGIVEARYMQNQAGATLPAGGLVSYEPTGQGKIGGAFATNTPMNFLAGGLAASMASGTNQYGWVIYKGPQTNVSASASTASSAGQRVVFAKAADIAVAAATYASTTAGYGQISVVGFLDAGDALATGGANTITWFWR